MRITRLLIAVCLAILVGGLVLYANYMDERASLQASGVGSGSPEPPLSADTLQALRERVAYQAGPTTEGLGSSLLGIAAGGGNVRPPETSRGWGRGPGRPGETATPYP
jgi:hypothetical protein